MKLPDITIGIPAYNEEANIEELISQILEQKQTNFTVSKILLISDGSTDRTVDIIKSMHLPKIQLIEHPVRIGVNQSLNELFSLSQSQYLLILNADTALGDPTFLSRMIEPFQESESIGMVGANIVALPPKTFVEKIICLSHEYKKYIFDRMAAGNNIFNCHGRARIFSKAVYKRLHIPDDCPEDGYTYFACKQANFRFLYQKEAIVYFRSPQTLGDHIKQSVRFRHGINRLPKQLYHIPIPLFLYATAIYILRHPILMTSYLLLSGYTLIMYPFTRSDLVRFDTALTSKKII